MVLEFKLPDIGEGVAEGEIVKWLVAEGDSVEEHQSVVEVMTDKATVEIPAPASGRIAKIRADEGSVVPVGTAIFDLETSGSSSPAKEPEPAAVPVMSSVGGGGTIEFKLPDVGEGVAEGEIVKWLVSAGDSVAEHQGVVEVMTDKATVEIPSPASGRIASLSAEPGQIVPVGSVLFVLETSAAQPVAASVAATATPTEPVTLDAGVQKTNGRVLAVPSARRVARELGVDLRQVDGTGRNGVIRRADVESFARSGAAPATAAAAQRLVPTPVAVPVSVGGGGETRVPFRGVRRKIAEAMVRSKYTAPHFTVFEELDVTDLVDLRAEAKEIGAAQGVKVTYMPFIMKAVASSLARYPSLNSKLDEEKQEVVTYGSVHIGVATDSEQGLVVPVIRDVQAKGMLVLGAELGDLAERTRAGQVKQEELRGSTFTITNAGSIGGTLATPIINFPDVAILGVHRIMKRPGVVESVDGDRIEVRKYMNLSLSVDHRLVDGADAVRFLVHVKRLLENPGLLAL